MKLLHIDSSALAANSVSRQLTAAIVARWQDKLPQLQVEYRDLDSNPLPHLTARSLAQADLSETADAARTMEQFLAADVLVIGAPMYAEGTGPRAIAELNDRAFAWVRQTQIDIGALAPEAQPLSAAADA